MAVVVGRAAVAVVRERGGVSENRPIRTTRIYTKFLSFTFGFSGRFNVRFNPKENIVEIVNNLDGFFSSDINGFFIAHSDPNRPIVAATEGDTINRLSVNLLTTDERVNLASTEINGFESFSSNYSGTAWIQQTPSEQNGWWGVIGFQQFKKSRSYEPDRNPNLSAFFNLKIGLY